MSVALSIVHPLRPADPKFILPVFNTVVTGGAGTGVGSVVIDLKNLRTPFDPWGVLEVFADNTAIATGQSGPTAPGSSKSITVKLAFSDTLIPVAQVPASLANVIAVTLACTLANDTTTQAIYRSDYFVFPTRYVYAWYDNSALAANSAVGLIASIARI